MEPMEVDEPKPRTRPTSLPLPQREKYALRASTLQKSREAEEARRRAAEEVLQKKAEKEALAASLAALIGGMDAMNVE